MTEDEMSNINLDTPIGSIVKFMQDMCAEHNDIIHAFYFKGTLNPMMLVGNEELDFTIQKANVIIVLSFRSRLTLEQTIELYTKKIEHIIANVIGNREHDKEANQKWVLYQCVLTVLGAVTNIPNSGHLTIDKSENEGSTKMAPSA